MHAVFMFLSGYLFLVTYLAYSVTAFNTTQLSNKKLNLKFRCEDWLNLEVHRDWPCTPSDLHISKDAPDNLSKALIQKALECFKDGKC